MAEPELAEYSDMAGQVEAVVAAAIWEESGEDHDEEFKASISVAWELLRFLQGKPDHGSSLGRALTVTAHVPSHTWAVSCREYVEETWGAIGVLFLECLEEELMGCMLSIRFDAQGRSCDFDLGSIDDEISGRPALVTFWGTKPEICALGQFLSWIAATFRLPRAGQLSASVARFTPDSGASESATTKKFRIHMEDLAPVVEDEESLPVCWHSLFPGGVVASEFSVPPRQPGAFGLQVSFDDMLRVAGALDAVNLQAAGEGDSDGGIFFLGGSSILYPTAHFVESNTVQWHLVSNLDTEWKQDWSPDNLPDHRWARIRDFDMLRSATAILGNCRKAQGASVLNHF